MDAVNVARRAAGMLLLLGAACGGGEPKASRQTPVVSPNAGESGASAAAEGGRTSTLGGSAAPPPTLLDPKVVEQQESDAEGVLAGSCASASVRTALVPSNLLFVIDRSGSMTCNPPPTTTSEACEQAPARALPDEPSKWEITREALKAAMQKLPASARVGLGYFSNDDRCGVSSAPSVPIAALDSTQLDVLAASLDRTEPAGGTPLVGATILAYKHLHDLALQGQISGNDFVVLLTDGEQSEQCGSPMRCTTADECTALLLQDVPKAAGPGADIRTFVIGAPGSEPARGVLSAVAVAGKTAAPGCIAESGECHFDMTKQSDFSAALTAALREIGGATTRCELPLPEPDDDGGMLDPFRINVVYTPSSGKPRVLPQDNRKGCDDGANGWQFTTDNTAIRLCGAACSEVRAEPSARLEVVLGCPVQGPS